MRRFALLVLAVAAVSLALVSSGLGRTTATGPPEPDPNGVIDLPPGYSYAVLAESCATPVRSTECGAVFPMPDDFDANVLFSAPGGDTPRRPGCRFPRAGLDSIPGWASGSAWSRPSRGRSRTT